MCEIMLLGKKTPTGLQGGRGQSGVLRSVVFWKLYFLHAVMQMRTMNPGCDITDMVNQAYLSDAKDRIGRDHPILFSANIDRLLRTKGITQVDPKLTWRSQYQTLRLITAQEVA